MFGKSKKEVTWEEYEELQKQYSEQDADQYQRQPGRDASTEEIKAYRNAYATRQQALNVYGLRKRRKDLAKINAMRKEMGLNPWLGRETHGRNRVWNAKYKAMRNAYKGWIAQRDAAWEQMGQSARVLARKQANTRASMFSGGSSSSSGQGSNDGNIATYRRRGKTSLIQRAVGTGGVKPGTGLQT